MGSEMVPAESKGLPFYMNKYCGWGYFKQLERRVSRLSKTLFILVLTKISVVNTDLGHV